MPEYILPIVIAVLTVVSAIVIYYLAVRGKLSGAILEAIVGVEDLDAVGEEKKRQAVATVYAVVPAVLKPFITERVLENLIQITFDRVKEFAEKQS